MLIDFRERGRGGREREGERNMDVKEKHQPEPEPATWVCALTRNGTRDLSVYGTMLKPSEPGHNLFFFKDFIYLFLEREEGGRKRGRETLM